MPTKKVKASSFEKEARRLLDLEIEARINNLGGYGPEGEVIYEQHPRGCPSVLVDNRRNATATFMTNGSTEFLVKIPEGMDVQVLDGCFDPVEKRERNVPSTNVWLDVQAGKANMFFSLLNPAGSGCAPDSVKIVKLGDPDRSMSYCASFSEEGGLSWTTVVRHSLAYTKKGPALIRQVCVTNTGRKKLEARLWNYYNLHGTQRFVYNKELWYDQGLPLSGTETVVSATVPYSEIVQIKRLSSRLRNLKALETTCDYSEFVGDTSATAILPDAVRRGSLLGGGTGRKLNRFATSTIAASSFALSLARGKSAILEQSLLYVTDPATQKRFRRLSGTPVPTYKGVSNAFARAAMRLVKDTPDVAAALSARGTASSVDHWPTFEFSVPDDKAVSEYAKSVWTGVAQLYENCRAHGAKMAEGIELGTRDRAQDMWPKMKEDPGRVRADLVHAFSFMYVTQKHPERIKGRLTLEQKLHGMYPRQFPSRWDNRSQEVMNDNRPYTDSPLWLVNSLCRYMRETGDAAILGERVRTVRLSDPDNPENSGITGCDLEQTVLEAIFQIFACFERHAKDTPYGMAQVLYGDWCDPVDMYGTSKIGDDKTRGKGRGVQIRLSAHLFECLVETVDLLEARGVSEKLAKLRLGPRLTRVKTFAKVLRANIVKWAWEDGKQAGFLDSIHELKVNGRKPNYRRGETGYTLGSMKKRDFDRVPRRILSSQAYCLRMLLADREWLGELPDRDHMVAEILKTAGSLFFKKKLGLLLFSAPVASSQKCLDFLGRLGVFPVGCAENGEYHHGQVMMHLTRMGIPGNADVAWKHFKMVMSAMRDEGLCGPFDMPATSYVAAEGDPHFGKCMYFGLSGSTDWIVQIYERVAGLELNLADRATPDVVVNPHLPAELGSTLRFRRLIHCATGRGKYRKVPLEILIRREGATSRTRVKSVRINGKRAEKAEIRDVSKLKRARIEVDLVPAK